MIVANDPLAGKFDIAYTATAASEQARSSHREQGPREATLGTKHPHALDSVNNLTFMLKEVSRKGGASQLIRAARKDRKATLARAVP